MRNIIFKILTSLFERKIKKYVYLTWNHFLLYISGVNVGKNVLIYNKIYITHNCNFKKFVIGNDFVLTSGSGFNPLCRGIKAHINIESGATLVIGHNVGMSSPSIWCSNKIIIGNNVKLGANCTLLDTDCHSLNYQERRFESNISKSVINGIKSSPIIIGNDVMVGVNVIILKGVSIGDRTIVAAGSIVNKSLPSDCLAGGNPAKIIRQNYFK